MNIVVKKTSDLCDLQRSAYVLILDKTRQIYLNRLKKSIFRNIQTLVTSFALTQMLNQYEKLLKARDKNISLSLCTKHFKNIMSLSCAHIIQKRMIDADHEKMILITDVHAH